MAYNLVKQYFKKFDIIYFILIFNYNKLGKETQASSLTQSQLSITSNSIISLPILRVPPNLTIYAFHYPQKALTCQIPISPSLSISLVIHPSHHRFPSFREIHSDRNPITQNDDPISSDSSSSYLISEVDVKI
jgi:hypothetical protein